jgi:hypothetical protein
LSRVPLMMWRHVRVSHAGLSGVTELRRLLWRDWRPSRFAMRAHQSRQSSWYDSITSDRLVRLTLT